MFGLNWEEVLKYSANHQLGLALIIGFTGIILTLLFNGWRDRRSRKSDLKQERRTLRTALLNEAKIIRFAIEHRVRQFKGEEGLVKYDKLDTNSMSVVYRSNLNKLGLLRDQEVEFTVGAYSAFVDFVNAIDKELSSLERGQDDVLKFEPDDPQVVKVLWMYEKMFDNFEQAIQSLQKNR
jgi:hypothetical protein